MIRVHDQQQFGLRALLIGALLLGLSSAAHAALKINPTFDASINSKYNAAQIKQVVNSAIAFYQAKYTDNIVLNITFADTTSGIGSNTAPFYVVPYSTLNTALRRDATSANDTTALTRLPAANIDPVQGLPNVFVKQANLKALGIRTLAGSDGTVFLNTSVMFTSVSNLRTNRYDMYATICHELNQILGLGSAIGASPTLVSTYRAAILPEDLYRYDATGVRSFTTSTTAQAFFSLNSTSRLARFNQNSNRDRGDWFSSTGGVFTPQVQDAFQTIGVVINKNQKVEQIALDVIGYNLSGTGAAANSFSGAQLVGTFGK
jgi:hypothetical protein